MEYPRGSMNASPMLQIDSTMFSAMAPVRVRNPAPIAVAGALSGSSVGAQLFERRANFGFQAGWAGRRRMPTPCSPSDVASNICIGPASLIGGIAVRQPYD